MQNLITWLYNNLIFVKNDKIYDKDTKWLINFILDGKLQTKIIMGETQKIVRERFLLFSSNVRIESIVLLDCL